MTRWNSVDLGRLFPNELRSALNVVDDVIGIHNDILGVTRTALEIARALAALANANPLEAALDQLIQQIEDFIDALTEDTTVHAIMIPIQKQYSGLGVEHPVESLDPRTLAPNYDQLANDGVFSPQLLNDITPDTITFINNSNTAVGGNRGFWRELAISVQDEGDAARPRFTDDFAVGGVCLIFGAKSIEELQGHFAALMALFDFGNRADLAARTRPKVEDLKVLAVPTLPSGRIGVQVDWKGVPPVVINPLFSGERVINEEVFVIRSTDSRIRERFSWIQNFSRQPHDESTDLQTEGPTSVIARVPNDGFISRYIDDDAALTENTSYYYALAVRYRIGETTQPMSNLSAVRRIFYTKRPMSSRRGEPPDWWAVPSLIQLFPPLEGMINQIELFLASLRKRTVSGSGIIDTINQIIAQIDNLIAYAQEINDELQAIADILRALAGARLPGASSTVFSISTGGTQAWLTELSRRLSDTTDTSRPPYDSDELVAGVVILAGAPNLPTLDALMGLLRLFFGGAEEGATQRVLDALGEGLPTTTTAVRTGIDAVSEPPQSAISASTPAEVISFDAAMAPTRIPKSLDTDEQETIVFDDTMTPTSTIDCE